MVGGRQSDGEPLYLRDPCAGGERSQMVRPRRHLGSTTSRTQPSAQDTATCSRVTPKPIGSSGKYVVGSQVPGAELFFNYEHPLGVQERLARQKAQDETF